jgi:flagellar FliL protein
MPVQNPEPARSSEQKPARQSEAADLPEPTAVQARSGAGWQAWLPLGVALAVMPLLAFGVTNFVLVPRLQHALRSPGGAPADSSHDSHGESASPAKEGVLRSGQRQSVSFNKVLVNVAGTMGSRYLLASLTLLGDGADFASGVSEKEPQLRDMASGLLSLKTIADLEKPGARNVLRGELLAGFNSILGSGRVQEIYFTEFAIQ